MITLCLPCHTAKYGNLDFPFAVNGAGVLCGNTYIKMNHLREIRHFIASVDLIVSIFGKERRIYKNALTGSRFLGINNSIGNLRKDIGNKFSKFHHNLQQKERKSMDNFMGTITEKALRCTTNERPESEEATRNLQAVSTTPDASAQLPPLAADLEGLAVSLGVLAGKVSAEEWEFLKIFRANLRAAAERVAALEISLEVPHA